jgi:hypothetical protein
MPQECHESTETNKTHSNPNGAPMRITKAQQLIKKAQEIFRRNGHDNTAQWKTLQSKSATLAELYCKNCNESIYVKTPVPKNDLEISGRAMLDACHPTQK